MCVQTLSYFLFKVKLKETLVDMNSLAFLWILDLRLMEWVPDSDNYPHQSPDARHPLYSLNNLASASAFRDSIMAAREWKHPTNILGTTIGVKMKFSPDVGICKEAQKIDIAVLVFRLCAGQIFHESLFFIYPCREEVTWQLPRTARNTLFPFKFAPL